MININLGTIRYHTLTGAETVTPFQARNQKMMVCHTPPLEIQFPFLVPSHSQNLANIQ